MSMPLAAYSQGRGEASAVNSPRYRRAIKVNFSRNSEFEKAHSMAIVMETRRMNFHELEINRVSYSKTQNSGLTVRSTGANIRYQFALHLTKNTRFIPQIGLSLQLGGSSNLTTNPNPTSYTKVREYIWVIKPGLSFPCRFNISRRFFIDTTMIVNLIMIDGSRLQYYRLDGHKDVYGGWRKFAPFSNDRLYMKLGVGFKF
jgi:hypothetical protein